MTQQRIRVGLIAVTMAAMTACGGKMASAPTPKIVPIAFMGDSVTLFWGVGQPWCDGTPRATLGLDPAKYAVSWSAVCGLTSGQILTTLLPDVLAQRPGCVHLIAGTNDIRLGVDPAVTRANLAAIEQAVLSSGACLYWGTIPPWGRASDSWTTAAQQQQVLDLNAWILAQKAPGLQTIDYFSVLVAPDGRTFDPAKTDDGGHPNAAGYAAMTPLLERTVGQ
ncbi:MAG TPA: GDSL-type esterase/lipase family protein [Terriglobales bacterium]|nr:GDSL-type esterase/lipase family protein [Terriglobales bacterium]